MLKALTDAELRRRFGDPSGFLRADGTVGEAWEREILAMIPLPAPLALSWDPSRKVDRLRCHQLIAKPLEAAMRALYQSAAWVTIGDFGGVYQWRVQRRSVDRLSRHSWGIAIDLDVGDNPFGREPKVHPDTVRIFTDHGFLWGGYFPIRRRDGMHFEYAGEP